MSAASFSSPTGAAFAELGIDEAFVQDNHSRSRRGVVRGMHFQPGQAKLIRCVRGAILDVIVDIRRGSPQFGQWEAFGLDDAEHHQLYIPDGFAHGFCVLSEIADVAYKVSTYYDPELESGFAYDDPEVAIEWPGCRAGRLRARPQRADAAQTRRRSRSRTAMSMRDRLAVTPTQFRRVAYVTSRR